MKAIENEFDENGQSWFLVDKVRHSDLFNNASLPLEEPPDDAILLN